MPLDNVRRKFISRRGFFNQPYKSIRLHNCEITLDNLLPYNQYQLSICTPYNMYLDRIKHKRGTGAGEVKKCWYFNTEDEAYGFLSSSHIV